MSAARRWAAGAAFLLAAAALVWLGRAGRPAAAPGPPPGLLPQLEEIFSARVRALVTGDAALLVPLYDRESRYGRWALERETKKVRYVRRWLAARGVRLTGSETHLRVTAVHPERDTVWVEAVHTLGLEYTYRPPGGPEPAEGGGGAGPRDRRGTGTRHILELVRRQGKWLIRRDWVIDPLREDAVVPEVTPAARPVRDRERAPAPGTAVFRPPPAPAGPGRYRRAAAVAYADRYCGAASGCGNGGRYHPRYRDYTHAGGDCTNFVSQVLGDPEAGALPQDGVWRYDEQGGTRAWVRGPALVQYLLGTGRARLLARGRYAAVIAPGPAHPRGAARSLLPGDLIAYEERGSIEHLAVVVGADSGGEPVVDSHTADRFHVPWDLGWDRDTVFWLLRLED